MSRIPPNVSTRLRVRRKKRVAQRNFRKALYRDLPVLVPQYGLSVCIEVDRKDLVLRQAGPDAHLSGAFVELEFNRFAFGPPRRRRARFENGHLNSVVLAAAEFKKESGLNAVIPSNDALDFPANVLPKESELGLNRGYPIPPRVLLVRGFNQPVFHSRSLLREENAFQYRLAQAVGRESVFPAGLVQDEDAGVVGFKREAARAGIACYHHRGGRLYKFNQEVNGSGRGPRHWIHRDISRNADAPSILQDAFGVPIEPLMERCAGVLKGSADLVPKRPRAILQQALSQVSALNPARWIGIFGIHVPSLQFLGPRCLLWPAAGSLLRILEEIDGYGSSATHSRVGHTCR